VIDPAVGNPTEHQPRVGLADALDPGPAVVRIGLPQIRKSIVDGVGVDVDEASASGSMSGDGRGSVQ
jgi:hypothetical protein